MVRLRYVIMATCLLLIAGALIVFWPAKPAIDPATTLVKARAELVAGHPERAERLAREVLEVDPASTAALLIAAQVCDQGGRVDACLAYLDQLPTRDDDAIVAAHVAAGRMHVQQGHVEPALRHFQQVVAVRAQHVDAHRELARLLSVIGRRWESRESLLTLVKLAQANVEELLLLGNLEVDFDLPAEVNRFVEADPDDLRPRLALARNLLHRNQGDQARTILAEIVRVDSRFLEAQAWYGWSQVDRQAEFADWDAAAPVDANQHPLVWVARGMAASNNEQPTAAIRCFWEAARLDPNQQRAHHRLGLLLRRYGDASQADAFQERADRLGQLAATLLELFPVRHRPDALARRVPQLEKVAELCESLGRNWEATVWYAVIGALVPEHDASREAIVRLKPNLSVDTPQTLSSACLANQIDLSEFPLPDWSKPGTSPPADRKQASSVKFEDVARAVGIDFIYDNGHDPQQAGMPIYQVTGGGVGVIDFDADGWPDLYWTQGGAWPTPAEPKRDRLYRNTGGQFEEATVFAELGDTRFSQGIAVGDVDNDGFPDVYVANLGGNRLYLNQGDGTFVDGTTAAGLLQEDWTTSCLLADLDGDGLSDIYDVNYVAHQGIDIGRLCNTDGLSERTCPPRAFPSGQDRVFINAGDGTFHDATESSGLIGSQGYGLGIVAADFHGHGRLSLFVANDDTANNWYVNETPQGGRLTLVDRAMSAGVATDRDGQPQACMGVAAGDADGDGLLDLFVTNFHNQSNTLYRRGGDWFDDWTIPAGLRNDSFAMLGFGTQFIDGDLDGWSDVILANGHVDDYSYKGFPFKMPAQYYQNLGGGRFRLEEAGPFFSEQRLGRGLARLDWNRDGRHDIAISQIGDPAALLTNRTTRAGHFLGLDLRGVHGQRDAIGTRLEVKAGDRTWVHQLTAGDGYQASNSRHLIIGLGPHRVVDQLVVHWPGRASQRFEGLAADVEWILVEGSSPIPHAAAGVR